jgi:hypothetical protein
VKVTYDINYIAKNEHCHRVETQLQLIIIINNNNMKISTRKTMNLPSGRKNAIRVKIIVNNKVIEQIYKSISLFMLQ